MPLEEIKIWLESPPYIMHHIYHVLGFYRSSNWNSFKYMGIPIAQKRIKIHEWEGILWKIKDKMQLWGL